MGIKDILKKASELGNEIPDGQVQIAELQAQIGKHEAEIKQGQSLLTKAVRVCDYESERLDVVLEFLTLNQAQSRNIDSNRRLHRHIFLLGHRVCR